MSNTVKFSCTIDSTDYACPLGFEIWIDQNQIFNTEHVTSPVPFVYEMNDDEGEHALKFVLKNKSSDHTKINESGEIVSDARLTISGIEFDEISLAQMFTDLAVYIHDFNGSGTQTQDKFYGEMGCNGTVELQFATPIYVWLLENF
jgi:hypothetical protein